MRMKKKSVMILLKLKQCKSVESLKQIHAQLITKYSFHHPNHLLSKLIQLQSLHYSILLFSHIPHPNHFTFNILIRALATSFHNPLLAFHFYLRMLRSDLHNAKPNNYTFPFVLKALSHLRWLYCGRTTHASIFKFGLDLDPHTAHSLITFYLNCQELGCARNLFDGITDRRRDLVSWNSMISGFLRMGFAKEAVDLYKRMRAEGRFQPDERTLSTVLKACGMLGDRELGKELEQVVKERGIEVHSFVASALVNMLAKCGDLVEATRVFDDMDKRDLSVWNAMITGYSQNGMSKEAIKVFLAMRESGMDPDVITLASILPACASLGALELGSWLDDFALRKGLHTNVYVGTALVDMYAKCGNIDRALHIFESMPHKNVTSWNAMISAVASHGLGQEAINLFSHMLDEGLVPNDITFVALLSACVHSGLVDEGHHWFDLMEGKFGISPQIEHYSCMVDLLARAGKLEQAWEFIEKMPETPDAVVLGALLCACRNFKNVEVGERVMKKILELEPSNSGNYVISSKIYACSHRWEDSARMRGLMRERGVSKTPGCSWIEIDGQTREFHAGDGMHTLSVVEFDWIISHLFDEMKKEGYTPDVHLV